MLLNINQENLRLRLFIYPSFNYNKIKVYIYIQCKLYLIKGLKENMLISNDIFDTKNFSINFSNIFIYIKSCDINIVINAKYHAQYFKYKILANAIIFISLKSKALVFFKQMAPFNLSNFLFYPSSHLTLYAHLVNYTIFKIFVRNDGNYFIQILRYYKLGYITELLYKNCFAASMSYKAASSFLTFFFLFHKQTGITILSIRTTLKMEL